MPRIQFVAWNVCFLVLLQVRATAENIVKLPAAKSRLEKTVLFRQGEHGSHTYRISALVVSTKDTVLAFAEARRTTGTRVGGRRIEIPIL